MKTTVSAAAMVERNEVTARWLATGLLALGLAAMPAAAADATNTRPLDSASSGQLATGLRVQLRGDRLSVEADDQPLAAVLREVTQQTGAVFHLGPAGGNRLTVAFNDAPIADALRRLLGPHTDFILYYRDASLALPDEVRVLGPDQPGAPAESDPRPINAAASEANPGDDLAIEALEQLLASDPEPHRRSRAAVTLASIGSPRALTALRRALADPETAVRARVVDALAMRGGDDAIALLREAMRDPDVDVQRVAMNSILALENREGAPLGASLAAPIEQSGARENGANTPSVSLGQTRR